MTANARRYCAKWTGRTAPALTAPTWATLLKYQKPQWYKDAKFGIFIHWGVYLGRRRRERVVSPQHVRPQERRLQKFKEHFANGDDAQGYKDLIPQFRAEKFNATEWAQLFKASGAQYVVPVAEHHDGFSMYDSRPLRLDRRENGTEARHADRRLATAVRAEGLHFGLSSHRAEHNFFYSYGRATAPTSTIRSMRRSTARRTNGSMRPAMRTASTTTGPGSARHGRATGWPATPKSSRNTSPRSSTSTGGSASRHSAAPSRNSPPSTTTSPRPTATPASSISRTTRSTGSQARATSSAASRIDIIADHWQTDTSISNASWGYIEHDTFKSPEFLVHQLDRHRQQERQLCCSTSAALRRHRPR